MSRKPKPVTFASRLRQLRSAAGITAAELARKSGVTKQAISRLEADMDRPLFDTVCKLAKALEISTEEFVPAS